MKKNQNLSKQILSMMALMASASMSLGAITSVSSITYTDVPNLRDLTGLTAGANTYLSTSDLLPIN
jgi:hypothetical protein